jgi:hypothetical protein
MTAQILYIRDYQKVPSPDVRQDTLEQQAVGLIGFITGLSSVDDTAPSEMNPVPYGGAGIDGMGLDDPA